MPVGTHSAAILEADGLITDEAFGWRFEASGAKGGQTFNPLEGWYPDKGGKLVSPRIVIPQAGAYYKLSFTATAPVRSYETVAFYDAAGNLIADNYDVIYPGGETNRYSRVVFAQEGVKEAEAFFQSPQGCTVLDVQFEPATVDEAAKWCDSVYEKLPPLDFAPTGNPLALAPKTLDALKTGKPWRILMLGDSIMQDTFHSQFHALVKRLFPQSDVTWLVSVRGSTGCWHYSQPENFQKYVADYKPDCVFIGGISGWIHPDMPLNGGPAIESVAKRANQELGAEVVVMTPTLATDLRVPQGTAPGAIVAPMAFDHGALGDKAWKYDVAAAEELKAICDKNGWPLWDMFAPAYSWLFKTGRPSGFYSRDYVHSGELGKQLIARVAIAYFAAATHTRGGTDDETTKVLKTGNGGGYVCEHIASLPVACREVTAVPGHEPSLLPDGKKFKLIWHDEFDGIALDESKWGYRTNFWGRRAHWFAGPEDGCVEVADGKLRLKLKKLPNGQFVSPQLQTGELMWDVPHAANPSGFWPLPKRDAAKFRHRYGYYECRCRLQKMPGWWSAFWMQSEQQGCSLDPASSGIEHDIMESFDPGEVIVAAFHMNGYGPDYKGFHIPAAYDEEPRFDGKLSLAIETEGFHTFGLLWEPDGYSIYVDGRLRGRNDAAVSHVPEFVLLTTEAKWYRNDRMTGKPVPELETAAAAGDDFVVDYVRVYDVVE